MSSRFFHCALAVTFILTGSLFAEGSVRTFADANFRYTLPGKEWKWIDVPSAPGMIAVVVAEHEDGCRVVVGQLRLHQRPAMITSDVSKRTCSPPAAVDSPNAAAT